MTIFDLYLIIIHSKDTVGTFRVTRVVIMTTITQYKNVQVTGGRAGFLLLSIFQVAYHKENP